MVEAYATELGFIGAGDTPEFIEAQCSVFELIGQPFKIPVNFLLLLLLLVLLYVLLLLLLRLVLLLLLLVLLLLLLLFMALLLLVLLQLRVSLLLLLLLLLLFCMLHVLLCGVYAEVYVQLNALFYLTVCYHVYVYYFL